MAYWDVRTQSGVRMRDSTKNGKKREQIEQDESGASISMLDASSPKLDK